MSENGMVSLTIDGVSVQAPKGTLLIEAAKRTGIPIPHYCYHPGLSVVGNCRMCLVEIEKIPKLQPSCATPVGEGMVVRTQTEEALRNRQSVLEFLLLNHPLDCPVCDQAGECELQNYYMDHGAYDSRFNENKMKRKKAFPIGPQVMLDQERCILCTRCVRFTREISKTGELSVHDRGHLSEIDIFPGEELDNPYSGNVVDICPVGALTDRDFRFQCRVWFLESTPSVCPGCSRGCNIDIHVNGSFNPRYHEKRVQRLKPRHHPEVNNYWICDEGRYSYRAVDAPSRLQSPRVLREDGWSDATWEEAIGTAGRALRETLDRDGPDSVAVMASPQMTNEELYSLRRLFKDTLKVGMIEFRVPPRDPVFSDNFLITPDKNPNSRGAEILGLGGTGVESVLKACEEGRIRFLYIFHHDLTRGFDPERVRRALAKGVFTVFQGSWDHPTSASASVQLPAAVYAEKDGTFTNVQGRVQRIRRAVAPLGEALPDLEILARLSESLGEETEHVPGAEVFLELAGEVPAFRGMTWDSLGDRGQVVSG